MKNKKNSISLLTLSIVFLFFGLFVILFSTRDILSNYYCIYNSRIILNNQSVKEENKVCSCKQGKVLCVNKTKGDNNKIDDSKDGFTQKGLSFKAEYLTNIISKEIDSLPLKTKFESIEQNDKTTKIVINSVQMCKKDLTIAPQYGLYKYEDNRLILQNNVNTVSSIFDTQCVVKAIFEITDLDIDIQRGIELLFTDQSGYYTTANVCVYNSKLYNSGDKYYALDKCNICTCVNGTTQCTEISCY